MPPHWSRFVPELLSTPKRITVHEFNFLGWAGGEDQVDYDQRLE